MKANVAYLKKRPITTAASITQFLEPFTTNVWLTILTSIFVVTLSIYFVDFVGPNGWRQWRIKKEGKPGNQFNLFNSLWFTMGCILRQGTYVTPRSFPSMFTSFISIGNIISQYKNSYHDIYNYSIIL